MVQPGGKSPQSTGRPNEMEREVRMKRATIAALMIAPALAGVGAQADAQSVQEKPVARTAQDASLKWGACPAIFPKGCQIAVLHGDPAKPNADVFLRVPAGETLAAHSHSSAERMVLVSGRLTVQYQGSPATTLTPGQYAYGPAKLPHTATCRSAEPCTLFIAFEGPVDAEAFSGALK
jgi:quercetin dioxygenase-like cupin family protein